MAPRLEERDEKLVSMVERDVPKIAQPKCPKCAFSPLEFHCNVIKTGMGHVVAVMWCSHCGHTLQTQFVGMDAPQVQAPVILRPT